MPNLTIRPAVATDTPLLLQFIHELAAEEGFADPILANVEELRQALFSAAPAAFALVACLDDEPVGFAVYYFTFSTTLARRGIHLDDLYVRSSARGHGVGRELLRYLARLATTQSCGRLEWWALRWNEKAIGYYRSLGVAEKEELLVFRASGEVLTRLAEKTQ